MSVHDSMSRWWGEIDAATRLRVLAVPLSGVALALTSCSGGENEQADLPPEAQELVAAAHSGVLVGPYGYKLGESMVVTRPFVQAAGSFACDQVGAEYPVAQPLLFAVTDGDFVQVAPPENPEDIAVRENVGRSLNPQTVVKIADCIRFDPNDKFTNQGIPTHGIFTIPTLSGASATEMLRIGTVVTGEDAIDALQPVNLP